MRLVTFLRTGTGDTSKAINISRRKRGNPAVAKTIGDETRKKRIHRPGERFLAGRAEFHSRHVDNVGGIGQVRERSRIEKIATDRFDAPGLKFCREPWGRKARDSDDAAGGSGGVGSAAGHASERGAHFSPATENE